MIRKKKIKFFLYFLFWLIISALFFVFYYYAEKHEVGTVSPVKRNELLAISAIFGFVQLMIPLVMVYFYKRRRNK